MSDQTWTLFELLWTGAHAIGVLVNLKLLEKALEKRDAARAKDPSATRDAEILSADRYIRNHATRLLFFALGALLGFWALAVPDGDALLERVAEGVLISMAFLPLFCSLWDLVDEPAMDRILEREADEALARDGALSPATNSVLRELQERRRARLARLREGAPGGPE